MSFDLKQKYSISYQSIFGRDIPFASSMRLLANGEQISQTYNPNTYAGDSFVNHFFDLNQYLGSFVELCFETRNWQSAKFDGIGVGDAALIDNIRIGSDLVSHSEVSINDQFHIQPNPVSEVLNVTVDVLLSETFSIQIFNSLGQEVHNEEYDDHQQLSSITMDVSRLPKGIYRVFLSADNKKGVKTFVKFWSLDLNFKKKVLSACFEQVNDKIIKIERAIAAVIESRDNETKSSVGDKYETGRAMMQNEQQRLESQLSIAKNSWATPVSYTHLTLPTILLV